MQRAAGDQDGGNRAATLVELGLEDVAGGEGVRVALELENVGLEKDRLEKVVDADLLLGGDVHEHVLATPLLGDDAVLGELLADLVGVGTRLVDLVDGDDDGHACGLRVVNRLDGLGHDAIVGSDDQDDDIGDLGTTGTHGGERLVTRGVDEGDDAVVDLDLGGANGLRDAASLALGDAGVADGVKQRGLAVVNVTHDGDDRGARQQVRGVVVEREGVLLLLAHDLDLTAQVVGDELDEVVGHRLGEGQRVAEKEQALDDVVGGNAEKLGELGDSGALRDLDRVELRQVLVVGDCLLDALLLGCLLGLLLAALLALLAAAGRLAAGLLDGGTGLLEDVLAVVLLRGTSHARVTVLAGLLAATRLVTLAALGSSALGAGLLAGNVHGLGARLLPAATAGGVVAATRVSRLGLGLRAGGLGGLLREDLLLLGNLVEQAGHGGNGLGGGVLHAVALGLLGGKALGLAALLLLGAPLGTALLLGGAALLLLGALGLAALLGSDALFLGLGLRLGLLGRLLFGLGLLGGLDLGRAGLEDRGELLLDHVDVRVLERGGRRGRGDLHVLEVTEHLLAGHAIFLGEDTDSGLCHVHYLPEVRRRFLGCWPMA